MAVLVVVVREPLHLAVFVSFKVGGREGGEKRQVQRTTHVGCITPGRTSSRGSFVALLILLQSLRKRILLNFSLQSW